MLADLVFAPPVLPRAGGDARADSPHSAAAAAPALARDRFPTPARAVAGMSICSTPERRERVDQRVDHGRRRADGADLPMPLTPSGLVLQGTSSSAVSMFGIVSARGMP